MRAGKLKTKRYRVRKSGGGWLLLLALGALLGAGGMYLRDAGLALPLPFAAAQPAATLPPEDETPEERTLQLPGHTWYALQLGAFDSAAAAQSLADAFQARGAAGYVARQDTYRVLAAAYETRADAQAVMNQLRTQHQVDAVLAEIIQPEVTLRLSGPKSQLTALADAYDALEQLAEHLSALSAGLDKREVDRDAAVAALTSQRDTLTALKERLAALFGSGAPRQVSAVAELLSGLSQSLMDALSAQGSTALGAKIKYAQLQCLCGMADYGAALGGI